ncbi:MAG TPA: radical SAM protein [Myxococcales bacterium]
MDPVAIAYRPHYCVWELTLACNLRCAHCGSHAGRPRTEELDTAQCIDVVEQLADLDCRLITLSGGEPTLRDDWEAIAAAAVRRGVTVNMVTNGTTITPELARRIAGSGLVNVGVSLDGPEHNHDSIRGPGTFARAARGLRLLRETGVPTAVLTHLDRSTAGLLEETHQVAVELGAAAWRVQLGKPMGRLCENRERLLEPEDLLTVLPRLARIKESSSIWVDVGDSVGYYGPFERTLRRTAWGKMRDTWSGCQAGRFAIGIESDGGVKGCLSLQAKLDSADGCDPFREGDLREKRLAEIWFADGAFAFNREQRVEDLTGACRRCSHAAVCRGGAKCVAAAFTGAVSEDPYCYHRVARAASPTVRLAKEVRRGAAAAALGLGVSACLGSCFSPVGPGEEETPGMARQDAATEPPVVAPPGEDAGYDPCVPSCPTCDYGVLPPECFAKPDAGAAGPDAAMPDPCVCLDYGVMPDPAGCCAAPTPPDAGDPCENVCCECDYGVVPPGCCK